MNLPLFSAGPLLLFIQSYFENYLNLILYCQTTDIMQRMLLLIFQCLRQLKMIFLVIIQTIKLMAMNNQSILLIDPEIAQKQFEKELETKKKLEELKGPVFKNFTIKKSKSVIHPITRCSQQLQIQPINQNKFHLDNKLQKDQLGVTNIKFELASLRRSKSIKVSSTARNFPSFSPRKTCPPQKTSFFIEQKIKEALINPESKIRKSVSTKIKAIESRDSQTILRKNSLFLVNCLRTRYKQSHKKAHIGQTQAVGNMRLGFFTQKQASLTHYQQRFEYMEEARQRLLNAQQADPNSRNGVRSPLLPEPW